MNPQARHAQILPLGLCLCPQQGHWLLVPRLIHPGLLVRFHAEVPDLGRFHLSRFQATKQSRGKMLKLVDAHRLHSLLVSFDMLFQCGQHLSTQRAVVSFGNLFHLFQDGSRKADGERFGCFFSITHASIIQQKWVHVKWLAKKGAALSSRRLKADGTSRVGLLIL